MIPTAQCESWTLAVYRVQTTEPMTPSYYAPPLIGGGIKRCFLLTSVAFIGPKSRTKRPRKTKIGTEVVAHVTLTRTPLSRSSSRGRSAHRHVGASGGCSGGRENVLAVGNCCYVAVCSAVEGASAPTGEERGGGYRGGHPPTACY